VTQTRHEIPRGSWVLGLRRVCADRRAMPFWGVRVCGSAAPRKGTQTQTADRAEKLSLYLVERCIPVQREP
jgi:hypothetical protein